MGCKPMIMILDDMPCLPCPYESKTTEMAASLSRLVQSIVLFIALLRSSNVDGVQIMKYFLDSTGADVMPLSWMRPSYYSMRSIPEDEAWSIAKG